MSDLTIFSTGFNTKLLQESAHHFSVPLLTFPNRWTDWVGVKLELPLRYLSDMVNIRPSDILMWLDGDDTLVCANSKEILDRHRALGSPFLMAAEINCWPDEDLKEKYPRNCCTPDANFPRYINAGGFIGTTTEVLSAMHLCSRMAKELNTRNDQLAWHHLFIQQSGGVGDLQIGIDYGRRIFASIGDGVRALMADSCTKHWNGKTPGREEYWDVLRKKSVPKSW